MQEYVSNIINLSGVKYTEKLDKGLKMIKKKKNLSR